MRMMTPPPPSEHGAVGFPLSVWKSAALFHSCVCVWRGSAVSECVSHDLMRRNKPTASIFRVNRLPGNLVSIFKVRRPFPQKHDEGQMSQAPPSDVPHHKHPNGLMITSGWKRQPCLDLSTYLWVDPAHCRSGSHLGFPDIPRQHDSRKPRPFIRCFRDTLCRPLRAARPGRKCLRD